MPVYSVDKSGMERKVTQGEVNNFLVGTASMGTLGTDPTGKRITPQVHSVGDVIEKAATAAPFFLAGPLMPEAAEGASLAERAISAGGRAALSGGANVLGDIIGGGINRLRGKPSGLTPRGLAESAALGAAGQGALDIGGAGLKRATGETGAALAAKQAMQARRETAGKLLSGNAATAKIRSLLGATATTAEPEAVNAATIESQNSLGHAIGAIHQDINQDYQELLGRYKNKPAPATFAEPLAEFQAQLKAEGRPLSGGARTLLSDAIEAGATDPLAGMFDSEQLATLSPRQRANLEAGLGMNKNGAAAVRAAKSGGGSFRVSGEGPVPMEAPVPSSAAPIGKLLNLQHRAGAILRSRAASASDKAVARRVDEELTGSLDQAAEQGDFLNPLEQAQHRALKARTRGFYNDFSDLLTPGRTSTPGELGAKIFKEPPHVVQRIIQSAAAKGDLPGLQRAFADYAAPAMSDFAAIQPKLAEMDQSGNLKRLYPGRYGRLADWTSTKAGLDRIAAAAETPEGQAAAEAALRDAAKTPEGRRFRDAFEKATAKNMTPAQAALESLRPNSGQGIIPHFMLRWIGIYQPLEAIAGFGMMHTHPAVAAGAFATFLGHTAFHHALQNEATRRLYFNAVTNKTLKGAIYYSARLAMSMALSDSPSRTESSSEPTTAP